MLISCMEAISPSIQLHCITYLGETQQGLRKTVPSGQAQFKLRAWPVLGVHLPYIMIWLDHRIRSS